jgi:hypothetical protein
MVQWRVVACVLVLGLEVDLAVFGNNVPPDSTFTDVTTPPTLERRSRSNVIGGLQTAVTHLEWHGDRLLMVYNFRWVAANPGFIFIRRTGVINFRFWDKDANKISSDQSFPFILTDRFLDRKTDEYVWLASIQVPAGATKIAFELGASGIVTNPLPIP